MNHKEMTYADFRDLLIIRIRQLREASPDVQERLAQRAWEMVQRGVPWNVILAATRAAAPRAAEDSWTEGESAIVLVADGAADGAGAVAGDNHTRSHGGSPVRTRSEEPLHVVDEGDLAQSPPPPLRHEVGRYERERLSANTRQAIRLARHARRWHEIRKMRNVLLNIDQGYLKRMLGAESDTLSQEINALLRSWAPLIRERQHNTGKRPRR